MEEIENKILINNKYITTDDFNKFLGTAFAERLKQAKLRKITDHNTVEHRAIENKEKIKKLQTFGLSYLQGKSNFADDESHHYLKFLSIYRYFKKIGNTDHISKWISKALSHETS